MLKCKADTRYFESLAISMETMSIIKIAATGYPLSTSGYS